MDPIQAYKWVFTYNTSEGAIAIEKVHQFLIGAFRSNENINDATFQIERGEETGRMHIQGRLHLVKKKTKAGVLNMFNTIYLNYSSDEEILKEVHLDMSKNTTVSVEQDASASIAYCSKPETRLPGTEVFHKLKRASAYSGADVACLDEGLRPWQEKLLDIIRAKPYNTRHVYWITDFDGGSGKSLFLKWLQYKSDYQIGEISDAGNASQLKATAYNIGPQEVYFVDLPRVRSDSLEDIVRTIETIKNGKLNTTLYGGGKTLLFNPPLMVVFSNYYPKVEWLSLDRWMIYTLTEDFDMVKSHPLALKYSRKINMPSQNSQKIILQELSDVSL